MMNENRVRIMTAIAAYEEKHKRELEDSGNWFRSDYIGIRMLKNTCRLTIAYLICLLFYGLLHFNEVMDQINSMQLTVLGIKIGITYGIALGIYLLLTYLVFSVRYYLAEKSRGHYYQLIDRLDAEYQREKNGPVRRRRRAERE